MKVLDIENIKIIGKNEKYIKSFTGRLILSDAYKSFKKEIYYSLLDKKFDPPYYLYMRFWMYHDIDAPLSVILDAMEKRKIIKNDRYIKTLNINKEEIKKGKLGKIQVFVLNREEIENCAI
jgi:hypothetical protein